MVRILILEDDTLAATLLSRRLTIDNHEVDCFEKAEDAIDACDKKEYDFMILDVTLHDSVLDGVDAASYIRKKYSIPFIFVTASDSEETYLRGINVGAISYVRKPVSHSIILKLIDNYFELKSPSQNLKYKDYTIDTIRNTITHNGEIVRLSQKPMEVVSYLIQNCGKVISKEELSEKIWPGEVPVTDDVINNTITRIRKELGSDFIVTHRGKGYEIKH